MNQKKILLILFVAFVVLLGGAGMLYNNLTDKVDSNQLSNQENQADSEEGSSSDEADGQQNKVEAPDFTVYDKEGKEVKLSDYTGKPVVLNFWASWCGPCKMEMPDFDEKCRELGDEVQFLMINMTDGSRETVETASEFIKEQGYEFPVFYDTESEAATAYGAYSLPTTYFIDAQGYAVAQATSAIDAETLQVGIEMIYKGE